MTDLDYSVFNDYVREVQRTESVQPSVADHWTGVMPPTLYRQHHATVGILTEVGEFADMLEADHGIDPTHAIEEVGDQFWYVALAADAHGFRLADIARSAYEVELLFSPTGDGMLRMYLDMVLIAASELLDNDKRLFYYRKPGKNKSRPLLVRALRGVFGLCACFEVHPFEVMRRNVAKLTVRYPKKDGEPAFSSDLAVNRDLPRERKALED